MVNEALTGTSLASDPPVHTQLRATLTENLSPRALRGLKGQIDAKADALVAELVEKGSFEAIDALARAFPLEVVADLIGFTGHVARQHAALGAGGDAGHRPDEPAHRRELPHRRRALRLVLRASRPRTWRPGSVGRGIFDAEARGDIPPDTAGHIIHQYLGAGVDTTIAAIGNIVALFAEHPDQLALVRENPALVPAAFNEVLRFWPPIHAWGRRATRDVEIDGVRRPGRARRSRSCFGAGNRDPRHYENPDAFLVERNPVDHLSFGYGPHGCAGQGLARLEAHAVIGALARRVERLVVGQEVRVPSNITRSIEELPVLEVMPA